VLITKRVPPGTIISSSVFIRVTTGIAVIVRINFALLRIDGSSEIETVNTAIVVDHFIENREHFSGIRLSFGGIL
jgi:hypothetical protein